jgi:hypothetical protein
MRSVWISWSDARPIRYDFADEAQVNAFLKGISEAADRGIFQFEQFDAEEDWRQKYDPPDDRVRPGRRRLRGPAAERRAGPQRLIADPRTHRV